MKAWTRTAVYDRALHVEAYIFDGVVQAFPNHVHEYYVIGRWSAASAACCA